MVSSGEVEYSGVSGVGGEGVILGNGAVQCEEGSGVQW